MKRVLLITPLSEQYSGIRNYGVPSLGVHRLASFLNAHGHEAVVYDCNIEPPLDEFMKNYQKFDIIGISILNNTLVLSLELLIKLKKQYPETLLMCGNAESTVNFEAIFHNTDCNIVITGEGEYPMLDICNDKPIGEIKGIIFRNRGIEITDNLLWEYYKDIDFSKMQWPKYFDINLKINPNSTEKIIRLVSSSHCRKNCTFCSLTFLHRFNCGKSVKPAYLSGEQIKILIQRAIDQIPDIQTIYFCEDSILPVSERIDDFCSALKAFPHLKYMVQTESDKVTYDIIKKLAEANTKHVSYGIENCSIKIRQKIGKPQDDNKINNLIPKWSAEFGMTCYYLIILFSPEVTIEDLIINYETLTRWQSDKRIVVSVECFMMPYKMARIYNRLHDFQWENKTLSNGKIYKYPTYILPDDLQAREIMLSMQKELPNFIEEKIKAEGHIQQSKDHTGKYIVENLGMQLKKRGYIK